MIAAPVFIHQNSFQAWAARYAAPYGFRVTQMGNWVLLARGGLSVECMSVDGVKRACQRRAG